MSAADRMRMTSPTSATTLRGFVLTLISILPH